MKRALRADGPLAVTLLCLAVLAVSTGLRLFVLPEWLTPQNSIQGQPIQNTPDAYHWLSGSVGLGPAVDNPMSLMLRWLAPLTGQSLDMLAFLLPALLGGLVGVAMVLWGRLLGSTAAGAVAGLIAVFTPVYYGRTQLGQFDTDFATLFFPCLAGWMLARWCGLFLDAPWLWRGGRVPLPAGLRRRLPPKAEASVPQPAARLHTALLLSLGLGAALQFMGLWHPRILSFNELALYLTFALALVSRRGPLKPLAFWALAVAGLAALHGVYGLAGAAGLCLLLLVGQVRRLAAWRSWTGALAMAGVLGAFALQDISLANVFWMYLEKFVAPLAHAAAEDIPLPSVTLTVAEEVKSLGIYLGIIHKYVWLLPLAAVGFCYLLLRRPVLVYLAPLVLLSIAGPSVGARLGMFAAPVMGLGLSVPLVWMLRSLMRPGRLRHAACAALLAGLLGLYVGPYVGEYVSLPAKPVLTRAHGEVLAGLRRATPENSWIWNEWVYGYATRYYSRRNIVLDGGINRRSNTVYLLSRASMSDDPAYAAGLLQNMANVSFNTGWFWKRVDQHDVQGSLETFAREGYNRNNTPPPQYLVVSFEHLGLLRWMGYFASWDFQSREGTYPDIGQIVKRFNVDLERGTIVFQGPVGPQVRHFETIDIVGRFGRRHREYPAGKGRHLLLHADDKSQAWSMGDAVYDSVFMRLLISKQLPPDLQEHFELAVEAYPLARAFRVK